MCCTSQHSEGTVLRAPTAAGRTNCSSGREKCPPGSACTWTVVDIAAKFLLFYGGDELGSLTEGAQRRLLEHTDKEFGMCSPFPFTGATCVNTSFIYLVHIMGPNLGSHLPNPSGLRRRWHLGLLGVGWMGRANVAPPYNSRNWAFSPHADYLQTKAVLVNQTFIAAAR